MTNFCGLCLDLPYDILLPHHRFLKICDYNLVPGSKKRKMSIEKMTISIS